jgi:predicted nucleic acid-binding protein
LLDNTVLTNLALVDMCDLVTQLWPGTSCTTHAVWQEYGRAVANGLLPDGLWSRLTLVTLTEQESRFAAELSARLGAGERTCLAVALYRHGLLASDDLDARRMAQRYDIPMTGTVGILARCVRRGCLAREQADHLLAEMIALGYRSPVTDLGEFLDRQ